MYDLHVHSECSDGDLSPVDVIVVAKERGLSGLALTDHNGLWGLKAAAVAAEAAGISLVTGIEISSFYNGDDVHVLGFAKQFDVALLEAGLRTTREGCRQRLEEMVGRCQAAGYSEVVMSGLEARYQTLGITDPGFVSFDLARELVARHGLSVKEAHRLVVPPGACYVPYGAWLLRPQEVIQLLHAAHGKAVLAHPGILVREGSEAGLWQLLDELVAAGLDGIEVRHPFHEKALTERLVQYAADHGLLMTAGSDWHGPSRFPDNEAAFGRAGLNEEEFARFMDHL